MSAVSSPPPPFPTSPALGRERNLRLVRDAEDLSQTSVAGRRYSLWVRMLRLALPLAALSIVVIMLSWPDMDKIAMPVPRESVASPSIGKNELLSPRFQAEDKSSQPYTITAEKAFQKDGDIDRVVLDQPVADLSLKDGSAVALKALEGEFVQSKGALTLKGGVRVRHNSGYELSSEQMDIDVKNEVLSTSFPVSGHGPAADIDAKGLKGGGASNVLIFKGPAKLVLRPSSSSSAGGAP